MKNKKENLFTKKYKMKDESLLEVLLDSTFSSILICIFVYYLFKNCTQDFSDMIQYIVDKKISAGSLTKILLPAILIIVYTFEIGSFFLRKKATKPNK